MNDENSSGASPAKGTSSLVTWGALALAALAVLGWQLFLRPKLALEQATKNPAVGQALPVLELQPLTGTERGMSLENVRGKVTLVNYWGTWCPPCVEEFPHLVDLWDRYRGQDDFLLVSVSSTFDSREDVPAVRANTEQFLKRYGASLPTYIDADGASRQVLADLLGERGFAYPTTVLLDRAGSIRAVWLGYQRGYEGQMEKLVSKLLAEK